MGFAERASALAGMGLRLIDLRTESREVLANFVKDFRYGLLVVGDNAQEASSLRQAVGDVGGERALEARARAREQSLGVGRSIFASSKTSSKALCCGASVVRAWCENSARAALATHSQ